MSSTTVEALKGLCAAIRNDGTAAGDIPGNTIPEVIDQITAAKESQNKASKTGKNTSE